MSNTREFNPVRTMEAIHSYGNKCYRKGYIRAGLEIYGSLAGLGLFWLIGKYLDKKGTKKEPEIEIELNSKEEAE